MHGYSTLNLQKGSTPAVIAKALLEFLDVKYGYKLSEQQVQIEGVYVMGSIDNLVTYNISWNINV